MCNKTFRIVCLSHTLESNDEKWSISTQAITKIAELCRLSFLILVLSWTVFSPNVAKCFCSFMEYIMILLRKNMRMYFMLSIELNIWENSISDHIWYSYYQYPGYLNVILQEQIAKFQSACLQSCKLGQKCKIIKLFKEATADVSR